MASSDPSRPIAAEAASGPNGLTLQIISPSVGVPQPLSLRGVPASTTVRQLKEKIRNALDTKPTDQAQRLIHRGRLLARDDETMLELFGEEAFRSTEHQSLHLVLRDLSDARPAFTQPPAVSIASQPTPPPPGQQPQQQQHSQTQPQPQPQPHQNHLPFFHAQPQIRAGAGPPQHPNSLFGLPQPQFGGVNHNAQWPPAWTQQHIAQNHRHIMATIGMGVGNQNQPNQVPPVGFGIQGMQTPQGRGTPGVNTPGRNASPFQPDATRTVIREGVGPNGQQWRITVNEALINPMQRPVRAGSPFPPVDLPVSSGPTLRSTPSNRHLSGNDVQNILQAADATSATRTMTDAMRRNASSSSLANLATNPNHQPIPPGVTTPLVQSRTGSAAGTPDPLQAAGRPRNAPTSHPPQVQSSSGTPEVYILSSPSGPRALLLNSSLDTYFSPQIRGTNPALAYAFQPRPFAPPLGTLPYGVPQVFQPQRPPMAANTTNPQPTRTTQPQQPQPQQHGLGQPPRIQPHLGHAMARPDNPQIQAVRIAQVWPHIWMIIRLSLFIWWFTSPSSSWSRWITVVSIAVTLFLVNTGLLNPITEQVWVPIRRHLENLIPLADGHEARHDAHPVGAENAQGANGHPGNHARRGEPNPEDAAARLVQQRRQQNANWLLNQARRLERAGLLFLASIAPGVAERHIAHLEAEARAEQQRREAAAEAAAAAAAAATQSENTGATEGEQTSENNNSSESGETTSQHPAVNNENAGNNNPPAVEEPLIAI
ncbi:hypothetical protein F5X96DRAFT_438494 [Biscogniauxia mediterranea]|nr:hypothetical protein F5X96DRAFT_438494 [Biscogniauxia mediterranea]